MIFVVRRSSCAEYRTAFRGADARQSAWPDWQLPARSPSLVQAAAAAGDAAADRDPESAAPREPSRHRGTRRSNAGRFRRTSIRRCAKSARSTAPITICSYPTMGSCGRRFGRNVPLEHTFPDPANLFNPNPRVVSRELMTRDRVSAGDDSQSAGRGLDPVHGARLVRAQALRPSRTGSRSRWRRATTGPTRTMRVPRSVPDPAPAGSTRPPAYANPNSHWWDGSQIYGSDDATAAGLRTGEGGKLKIEATSCSPVDPETGLHLSGFTDNWWVGLAMLHTLFTLEHNHICDHARRTTSATGRRAALSRRPSSSTRR